MDSGLSQKLKIWGIIALIGIITNLYSQESANPATVEVVPSPSEFSKIIPLNNIASIPIDVGFRDHYYGEEVISGITGEKPESKLWWNDGCWWGSLWNLAAQEYQIYRLDLTAQGWESTGIAIILLKSLGGTTLLSTATKLRTLHIIARLMRSAFTHLPLRFATNTAKDRAKIAGNQRVKRMFQGSTLIPANSIVNESMKQRINRRKPRPKMIA